MKLIHLADLHLDSKLNKNFEQSQARARREELIDTFIRVVEYANDNDVEAILIAGDLFDSENIKATARSAVANCILEYDNIDFYYVRGNHENNAFIEGLKEIPDNLKLFDNDWSTYVIKRKKFSITISAKEVSDDNLAGISKGLKLNEDDLNIVMLHGMDTKEAIYELRNKGIDYLALGHIHSYKCEKLDERGVYCYSGCLEGRGFDECGKHGFVLLDIDENKVSVSNSFVPFAKRTIYEIACDITGKDNTYDIIDEIWDEIKAWGCQKKDLLKIVLKGYIDVECELDLKYINSIFKEEFYSAIVCNEATVKIEAREYMYDESLKGEFVRCVLKDDTLSEEDKALVIKYGIDALMGELI